MRVTPDNLPPDIPPEARSFLERSGYFEEDPLATGDAAPDVALYTLRGECVALRDFWQEKPLVLVFGSYT